VLNLNSVVAEIETMLRRLIGQHIDLVVVPRAGLGSVKADPGQMEQVIVNLAVNARDAMPQGGHLTIETQNVEIDGASAGESRAVEKPGPYVMLAVSDTGVGMDEITREQIFEPFFTTKELGKGTGLGLSTVYGIVKQSDGFISVCSEVGRGTSFKLYLPRVAEVAGGSRAEAVKQPGRSLPLMHGTETILLVEDLESLRNLAKRMLESAGYTVLTASSGEEALLLVESREQPVALVITDLVMPGISGRTLAERLARTHRRMKVLYMSGYTADTIVRHGVLNAHMAFLNKPFSAADLLKKVRAMLDSEVSLEPVS
jgi:CheY-like chemotaxis protein